MYGDVSALKDREVYLGHGMLFFGEEGFTLCSSFYNGEDLKLAVDLDSSNADLFMDSAQANEPHLFRMDVGSNIRYGCPRDVNQKDNELAAKQAYAQDFIMSLPNGLIGLKVEKVKRQGSCATTWFCGKLSGVEGFKDYLLMLGMMIIILMALVPHMRKGNEDKAKSCVAAVHHRSFVETTPRLGEHIIATTSLSPDVAAAVNCPCRRAGASSWRSSAAVVTLLVIRVPPPRVCLSLCIV
ncbi:hypothetical protein Syun_018965 [Stephania yunnanensis]|uniref:Uncharacterized protein n=1 Tax=Stephania yunnanensis TaxID=152371 RepID=A0AAP0IT79_9MAGN